MLQSTLSEKKEKFSAAIKKGKDFHYLTIKSEPTRRFNWKNSPKDFNEFFPVSKRQKSFLCFKSKSSYGIIVLLEVSKMSFTGIVKIIMKGEKFRVNYGIVIF